ncbi:unnamed protein product, partial [Owenia fusiformis]
AGFKMGSFLLFILFICAVEITPSVSWSSCRGDCYFGDYLLVRRHYYHPTCPLLLKLHGHWAVNSHEPCFSKACELGGNVVHFRRGKQCFIYKCESNEANTDWDYKWQHRGIWGLVYAKPHPSTPNCANSIY